LEVGTGICPDEFIISLLKPRSFFSSPPPRPDRPGSRPASCPMGTDGPFPGVRRPEREADHSPPSSADVKNASNCRGALLSAGTTSLIEGVDINSF
jgi:hypothetical protein